jgi:hypothetical protein
MTPLLNYIHCKILRYVAAPTGYLCRSNFFFFGAGGICTLALSQAFKSLEYRLNMELDLQSLFGLHVT